MNLIRRYKLYKLGICPDDKHSELLKFLDSKISNLQAFEMKKKYLNWVFFMTTEGENIIQFYKMDNSLYIKNDGFFKIINNKYLFSRHDIIFFVRNIIEVYCEPRKHQSNYDGLAISSAEIEETYREYLKTR